MHRSLPLPVARVRNLKICLLAMLLSSGATTALGPPQFAGLGGVGGIAGKKCEPSVTTASGSQVTHQGTFCSGDLIFEDTFDTFDVRKWQHESTLSGGAVRIWMSCIH